MDNDENDENDEQIIALSTIDEDSFENCTEIIITEEAHSDGDISHEHNTSESNGRGGGVLDVSDSVSSEANLYPEDVEDALNDMVNDAIDDGEKKLAGGQHFMLNSTDALKEVLEEYYERTATRFVGWRKTKNFGLSSSECSLSGHQVQWCDTVRNTNNGLDNLVPFDGIPYMIVGHYDMDCQFGNDRNASGKAKRQQKKAAGIITSRTHHFAQPTKRCGCPAKISVKQIIRFPEFKIDSDSKWKKNDRSMKLKQKLKECRDHVAMDVYFVGRLPEVYEHKHHDSTKATEAVLQELIVLAQEFYLEEKTYSQIQHLLSQHVIEHLFWNKSPPHRSRRKFYPTLRDIRYFCTRAIHLLRFSDEEQEYMRKVISDIEAQGNVNVSFILSEGKMIKNDDTLLDENDSSMCSMDPMMKKLKKSDERKVQSFLFCTQTDTQRRLLKRFNNVAFLVEVVDKQPLKNALSYRLYTVIVQTNIDYQVGACIAVSKQKRDGLCDGLKLLREWNPTWNPKYFMVDCSPVIYEAVSTIFPECQYFLNPQSCEEKWLEYFQKPSNNLKDHAEEIMNYLKTMQYSLTEDSLSVAAALLEASDIWQDRDNLREWFQNNWLPLAKQWVFGYRPEDLLILQHLKATVHDSLQPYIEVLRKASKFKGFMEMIEHVSVTIPSAEYEKYVEQNKRAYLFYTHYSKTTCIPHYVKNVPVSLLPYIEGVCKLAESANFTILRDSYDAFTVQYNPIDDVMDSNPENGITVHSGDEREYLLRHQVRLAAERAGATDDEEPKAEMDMTETEFGWIEYSSKVVPGDNTISFGDSFSHPFCTCSHWLLYRLPCVHMMAIFYRTTGWKYDMISPLYRSSPLHEIDCSAIEFPIDYSPDFPFAYDKDTQTDFEAPVATATQTLQDMDRVLEVPSKIWDYFIVLTQTRNFLKHLDKMAFLFKDKNVHLKFRQQVADVINQLENDALKKRGQKIEFTTRNLAASKQTLSEKSSEDNAARVRKMSSMNVVEKKKTLGRSGGGVLGGGGGMDTKKIIIQNGSQLQLGGETITGIYRVGGKEVNNMKTVKTTNGGVGGKKPLSSAGVGSTSPYIYPPLPIPSLSTITSEISTSRAPASPPTNSPEDSSLVVLNNLPLLKDIREKKGSLADETRKRKLDSTYGEVITTKNENDVGGGVVTEKLSAESAELDALQPALKKKDYLSVLKYLPLLTKTISPKQFCVVSPPSQPSSTQTPSSKITTTSNMSLLKCLPPNVGLTRPTSSFADTAIEEKDVDISSESPEKEVIVSMECDEDLNYQTTVSETDVAFTTAESENNVNFTTESVKDVNFTTVSEEDVTLSTEDSSELVEQTIMYIISETTDSDNDVAPSSGQEKCVIISTEPDNDVGIPTEGTAELVEQNIIYVVSPEEATSISSQEIATTLDALNAIDDDDVCADMVSNEPKPD